MLLTILFLLFQGFCELIPHNLIQIFDERELEVGRRGIFHKYFNLHFCQVTTSMVSLWKSHVSSNTTTKTFCLSLTCHLASGRGGHLCVCVMKLP